MSMYVPCHNMPHALHQRLPNQKKKKKNKTSQQTDTETEVEIPTCKLTRHTFIKDFRLLFFVSRLICLLRLKDTQCCPYSPREWVHGERRKAEGVQQKVFKICFHYLYYHAHRIKTYLSTHCAAELAPMMTYRERAVAKADVVAHLVDCSVVASSSVMWV